MKIIVRSYNKVIREKYIYINVYLAAHTLQFLLMLGLHLVK